MKPNYFVGEIVSGDRTMPLRPAKSEYSSDISSTGGEIKATFDMRGVDVEKLHLRDTGAVWRTYLAVEKNGEVRSAGPIIGHKFNDNDQTLELTAAGLGAYWARRVQIAWPIVDLATDKMTITGVGYGTIAKRIVQNAMAHPGGALPIVLPDDEVGTRERNYNNFDLSWCGDLLDNLRNIINGPDIVFRPRMRADGLGVEWVMLVGTEADDEVHGAPEDEPIWDHSARKSSVSELAVTVTGANLNDQTFALGGGQEDKIVLAEAHLTGLRDTGFPLLQTQMNLNSVSEYETALGYAQRQAQFGQLPIETWEMKVRANDAPVIGSYREGDYVNVRVGRHRYIRPGTYRLRLIGFASDQDEEVVTLSLAPDRTAPDAGDAA
jgi:hypothetical protein